MKYKYILGLLFLFFCTQSVHAGGLDFNETFDVFNQWTVGGWEIVSHGGSNKGYDNVDADTMSTTNFSLNGTGQDFILRFELEFNETDKHYAMQFQTEGSTNMFQLIVSYGHLSGSNFTAYLYSYGDAGYVFSAVDLGVAQDLDPHNFTYIHYDGHGNSSDQDWCAWADDNQDSRACGATADANSWGKLSEIAQGDEAYAVHYIDNMVIAENLTDITGEGGGGGEPGVTTYFNATLQTINGSTLTTFNATINGTFYSTTNGTIVTTLNQSEANIVNITYNIEDYFSESYYEINTSDHHLGAVYNGVIHFVGKQIISNDTVHNGTFNSTFNSSYLNDSTLIFVAGTFEVFFNKSGYYSSSENVTVAALDNRTVYFSDLYTHRLNITTVAGAGGTVNNFTLNITLVNSSITSNPYNLTVNSTVGFYIFNLIPGNYSLVMDTSSNNPTYAITNVTLNVTKTLQNYTFSLLGTNSFNLIFLNEEGFSTMNNINITVEFISDSESAGPYYTTNASLYKDSLTPDDYIIRYSAAEFAERYYYTTLVNQTSTNLTLYLLNKTSGTNISINVYDSVNRPVDGAVVKALKYSVTTNSYIQVAMATMNFEGLGYLDLVLNSEYYKFLISVDGDTKKTTDPTYIYATDLTFRIDLGESIAQQFYFTQGISHYLVFDNSTNLWAFMYDDATNQVTEGCLYIYHVDRTERTLMNTSCVSSASSTIFVGTANITGETYTAAGYVTSGNSAFLIQTASYKFPESSQPLGKWGLLAILIISVLVGIAGFSWNAVAGLMLAPLPLLIGSLTGIVTVGIAQAIAFYLIAILAAWVISDSA